MGNVLDTSTPSAYAQRISEALQRQVIAQQEATDAVVESLELRKARLTPDRPTSMLLMGPTGVGKTHFVESLAKVLHGDDQLRMLKIDCAEYGAAHEVAKLIGSPPGYLGHSRGPNAAVEGTPAVFSQGNIEQCRSAQSDIAIILFDEIEKADDALHRLMLGIMDRGTVTLGTNETVYFRNTLLLMTSNLGVKEMHQQEAPGMGFGTTAKTMSAEQRRRCSVEAARRKFSPEFFNRIDQTVMFAPLSEEALLAILDLGIADLSERSGITVLVAATARRALVYDDYDPRYGARHLQRAIAQRLQKPLARLILQGYTEPIVYVDSDFDFVSQSSEEPQTTAAVV